MSRDDSDLDGGMQAAFARQGSRSEDSVLATIEALSGAVPRILLRDTPEESTPVLKQGECTSVGARYQVVGELARGGVGVVLKSRDVDLGRDVAMKVLRESLVKDPQILQRFVEEAQIGGQLQHPGIVPVYELGLNADKRPYFTMKLVKGKTLSEFLTSRSAPDKNRGRFLKIFDKICETMAYAHSRGVIHRDLKPSNVMVGAFGEVQIVDWGFAKVIHHGGVADERKARAETDKSIIHTVRSQSVGSESIAGSVMGTPAYMSPEQAMGDVERVDVRSDVFALGAILCEILTGAPPYTGKDVLVRAAAADLEDAKRRLDGCGADAQLVALCHRCLAPARRARPKHAGEVAREIASHLSAVESRAHQAQLAAAKAQAKAAEERRARRLTLALAASTLLLVCACAGGWIWWNGHQAALIRKAEQDLAAATATARTLRETARSGQDLDAWNRVEEAAGQVMSAADAPHGPAESRRVAAALAESIRDDLVRVKEAREHARRGTELSIQGTLDAGIEQFEAAIRLMPQHAEFHFRLGRLLHRSGMWWRAVPAYQAAARLDAHHFDARTYLFELLLKRFREYDKALEVARSLVRLRPDHEPAYLALGNAHMNRGEVAEAQASFEKALDLRPNWDSARTNLIALEQRSRVWRAWDDIFDTRKLLSPKDWILAGVRANEERGHLVLVARCFRNGLAAYPDPDGVLHYKAACITVFAATGGGMDADRITDAARPSWLRKARVWLARAVELWKETRTADTKRLARECLHHPHLASVRTKEALSRLPADERREWRKLWVEIEELHAALR